jgi:hypothetical protein
MIKKSNIKSLLGFGLSLIGLVAISGNAEKVFAQEKDPFAKPFVKAVKPVVPKTPGTTPVVVKDPNATPVVKKEKPVKVAPPPVMAEKVPSIEDRIAFYKKMREEAAMKGLPLPKPTTVMTIDELALNGVFHNSKGFSAIVEATPIKLSYTVYPGEKFFDGQLVAIEENRLVFRRITRMNNGKTVASEENKPLRIYTVQEQFQGTAPVEQSARTEPQPNVTQPNAPQQPQTVPVVPKDEKKPTAIVSPLEQWEKQGKEPKVEPTKEAKSKNLKDAKSTSGKKSVRVSETKKTVVKKPKTVKKPVVARGII